MSIIGSSPHQSKQRFLITEKAKLAGVKLIVKQISEKHF
jgi:hypothetical protein